MQNTGIYIPEELFQRLHEIGVGVKDSNCLDLGTGTGVVPHGMAKFGADIVATDISQSQIDEAIRLSANLIIFNIMWFQQRIWYYQMIHLIVLQHVSVFGILSRRSSCRRYNPGLNQVVFF